MPACRMAISRNAYSLNALPDFPEFAQKVSYGVPGILIGVEDSSLCPPRLPPRYGPLLARRARCDELTLGPRLSNRNLGFLGPGRECGLDLLEPGQDRGLVVATDRVEKLPHELATGREEWCFRVREVIA